MQIEARLKAKGGAERYRTRRTLAISAPEVGEHDAAKVRARVDRYSAISMARWAEDVRTIRARFKIGMMNIGYNDPPASARAGGGGGPLECAHGQSPCAVVQKDRAVPRQTSKQPHPGTSAATADPAKADIPKAGIVRRAQG